jgi:hypothetical protein
VIFPIDQDLTKMQVDTNVDESDVGPIRLNQTATFTVDAALPGDTRRVQPLPVGYANSSAGPGVATRVTCMFNNWIMGTPSEKANRLTAA